MLYLSQQQKFTLLKHCHKIKIVIDRYCWLLKQTKITFIESDITFLILWNHHCSWGINVWVFHGLLLPTHLHPQEHVTKMNFLKLVTNQMLHTILCHIQTVKFCYPWTLPQQIKMLPQYYMFTSNKNMNQYRMLIYVLYNNDVCKSVLLEITKNIFFKCYHLKIITIIT